MNWRLIAFEMGLFWNDQSSSMINCEAINPSDQSLRDQSPCDQSLREQYCGSIDN